MQADATPAKGDDFPTEAAGSVPMAETREEESVTRGALEWRPMPAPSPQARSRNSDSRPVPAGPNQDSLIPALAGGVCVAISLFVLAGWQFRIPWMKTLPGHLTVVAPNSALLLMCAGFSLILLRHYQGSKLAVVAGKSLAEFITVFSLLTLTEYIFHINLGIDTVFFGHRMADWTVPTPPGGFAFQAALAFSLAGLSLLLLDVRIARVHVSEVLTGGVTLVTYLSFLGYAYRVPPLHGVMALETTLLFAVLSLGLVFARPRYGATALLVSKGSGGIAARRLLATIVTVLTIFGWVESRLETAGLFELEFGTALMVAASAVAAGLLIFWTAGRLDAVDRALRRSEATLAQAGQIARLGAWNIEIANHEDLNASPLQWSDEAYRIFGYAPGQVEVSSDLFFQRVHPEDRQPVLDAMVQAIAKEKPYEIEHRIIRPDGVERIVFEHGEITFDHRGRPVRILGAVQDITERKRAEEALRQSENQFRTLTETIPQLCWMADQTGSCHYLSKRWEQYTGIPLRDLLGLGWTDTVHPGDLAPLLRAWARATSENTPYAIECRLRNASGHYEWFLARAVKLPDRDLWFGTTTNIEEIKRTQRALIRSEKLASVGRMAATIAHEINNPLAAVMNTLFLAKDNANDPEFVRQYLDIADAELRRISHITRQALGFYRESSAPETTSIGGLLDSVLDLLQRKIKEKRVTVEKQYDDRMQVTGVAGELRQVFSNLVANSLDAVGENGMVKLRVSASPSVRDARQYVRVTVADNGRGIDAASLPHIFEPFFTTKDLVGTGLGLWVSKEIVDKHGGSIRVHSRTSGPRCGTVFSLLLPAEPAGQGKKATASAVHDELASSRPQQWAASSS